MSVDTLLDLLMDSLHPERYCHVLLDPLAIPGHCDEALLPHLCQALGKDASTPVARIGLLHAPKAQPLLVCLSSPGEAPCPNLLKMTAQTALRDAQRSKRQVCGWLFTESPAAVIGPHLTSICQLPAMEGQAYAVYEPVRLELLIGALSNDECPWWPIQSWIFVSSGGDPLHLIGEQVTPEPLPSHARAIQDDAVLVEGVLTGLRTLHKRMPSEPMPPLPAFVAATAARHLRDARALGLSEEDDLLSYALHHLCLHPVLHSHTAVDAMISTAVREHRPLTQLFAQYTDANWQHVRSSLPPIEVHP